MTCNKKRLAAAPYPLTGDRLNKPQFIQAMEAYSSCKKDQERSLEHCHGTSSRRYYLRQKSHEKHGS